MDREEYSRRFDFPDFYWNHDAELVGAWLRENTKPEDTVVVRGFESEIYASSQRHFTGRFFWTTILTEPRREYRRQEFLAADRAAIEEQRPRYAVGLNFVKEGLDSAAWLEQFGYVRRVDIGRFTILERPADR